MNCLPASEGEITGALHKAADNSYSNLETWGFSSLTYHQREGIA
jgi:hypothetical protein